MVRASRTYFPQAVACDVARPDGRVGISFAAAMVRRGKALPCSVIVSKDGGATWPEQYQAPRPGTFGVVTTPPGGATGPQRYLDASGALRVRLAAGSLESLSSDRIDQGAGRIVAGKEVMAFETCTPQGGQEFELSGLYRLLGGSAAPVSMGWTHALGEPFLAFDGSVGLIPYRPEDVGSTWQIKAVGAGFTEANVYEVAEVTIEGAAGAPPPIGTVTGVQDGLGNIEFAVEPADMGWGRPLRAATLAERPDVHFEVLARNAANDADGPMLELDPGRMPRDAAPAAVATPELAVATKLSLGYATLDPVRVRARAVAGAWTGPWVEVDGVGA